LIGFSTAFEGAFAGGEQVVRNFANGDSWSQNVRSAILSSILLQGGSEILSNGREILLAGGRLLRAGDNLVDDLSGAFGGRRLATPDGLGVGKGRFPNEIEVKKGGDSVFASTDESKGINNIVGGSDVVPKPVLEDVTTGPHGPDRPLSDVVSRGRIPDPRTGLMIPQGRWLSREAGELAVSTLDTSRMSVGEAFSVAIESGSGVIIRTFNEFPPSNLRPSERFLTEPAERAVVILKRDGRIHTFPIGPEHPAFNKPAPTR